MISRFICVVLFPFMGNSAFFKIQILSGCSIAIAIDPHLWRKEDEIN